MENFSDEVLIKIGISPERYRSVSRGRHFTYEETQRIIAHFELTAKELDEL